MNKYSYSYNNSSLGVGSKKMDSIKDIQKKAKDSLSLLSISKLKKIAKYNKSALKVLEKKYQQGNASIAVKKALEDISIKGSPTSRLASLALEKILIKEKNRVTNLNSKNILTISEFQNLYKKKVEPIKAVQSKKKTSNKGKR